MKIWHIRNDKENFARAFAYPENMIQRCILWARGWRKHIYGDCWCKGSYRTRTIIEGKKK